MITLLCRIFAIIGLGVTIGAADSWLRPAVISLKPNAIPVPARGTETSAPIKSAEEPISPRETAPSESDEMMIDAMRAKEMFDSGVVFLDARIESAYKEEHVAQAFWLNSKNFGTPAAADAMKVLDASQPVVIYCDGGDCDASKNLAILLQQAGFARIYIFEAGFPDWKKHGFPVESTKP
ncbi:MAG: rhodanese-like domain-containing protein [Phycisphaeraceae bacterium]|nr:rhodanese-like domain-containing protein [Phycisphaeraceae bacterium]